MDQLLLQSCAQNSTYADKKKLINKYQKNNKDGCCLLAIEDAINYLKMKSQLPYANGENAYSVKAAALNSATGIPLIGALLKIQADKSRNEGMIKERNRLIELERYLDTLDTIEDNYSLINSIGLMLRR
jgi:hypothetical protein